jgi:predicted nucleotidyltransferase
MRQNEIIEAVTKRFATDNRLKALFLSGSYGNGTYDAWSDVDFLIIVDDDNRQAVKADFLKAVRSVGPMISSNTLEMGATLVHSVLEDWTRVDVVLADERGLGTKAQDSVKALVDPGGLWAGLPETLEWRGPNPHQVEYLIKEFTRILGMTSIGKGRDEVATAITGCGLLRTNLIALMTQAVPLADPGGILHMKKIFSEEHQAQVLALPAVETNWNSIFNFNRACAVVFYPLARSLAKDAGVPWPKRFVEATRVHLKDAIGLDIPDM